jgi:hypothetical protein
LALFDRSDIFRQVSTKSLCRNQLHLVDGGGGMDGA